MRPTTAQPQLHTGVPTAEPRTRRALLAGAVGGIGAWAAAAIARVTPAQAAAGDPVRAGRLTTASGKNTTLRTNSSGAAFTADQLGNGIGVQGISKGHGGSFKTSAAGKYGLVATQAATSMGSGAAIRANGKRNTGLRATTAKAHRYAVEATNDKANGVAVLARNTSGATSNLSGVAVRGLAADATVADIHPGGAFNPAAGEFAGTIGIIGAASQPSGVGVLGRSTVGFAVFGSTVNGIAGYFNGPILGTKYLDLLEQGAPPAQPQSGRLRIFVQSSGGKLQLCVRLPSGDT